MGQEREREGPRIDREREISRETQIRWGVGGEKNEQRDVIVRERDKSRLEGDPA